MIRRQLHKNEFFGRFKRLFSGFIESFLLQLSCEKPIFSFFSFRTF